MSKVNCIILAGGNSKRMTFNKEFIKLNEDFLIHKSIKELKKVFNEIKEVTIRKKK